MYTNAFIGKTKKPTESEVARALGVAKSVWDKLLSDLAEQYELTECEWNSYSPKYGWALRIKRKKRNIIYLSPAEGYFRITMILGGKAMKAAYDGEFPVRVVKILKESKKYPEGNAIYIDVKATRDIPVITKLAGIKLAN